MLNRQDLAWPTEMAAIYNPSFIDEETPERLVSMQCHMATCQWGEELSSANRLPRSMTCWSENLWQVLEILCASLFIHKTEITVALHGVEFISKNEVKPMKRSPQGLTHTKHILNFSYFIMSNAWNAWNIGAMFACVEAVLDYKDSGLLTT